MGTEPWQMQRLPGSRCNRRASLPKEMPLEWISPSSIRWLLLRSPKLRSFRTLLCRFTGRYASLFDGKALVNERSTYGYTPG